MTVNGTERTAYRLPSAGNSCTSITSALMQWLSRAKAWATRATLGQYTQAGVTNTWMCTGWLTWRSLLRVSMLKGLTPREMVLMSSMTVASS